MAIQSNTVSGVDPLTYKDILNVQDMMQRQVPPTRNDPFGMSITGQSVNKSTNNELLHKLREAKYEISKLKDNYRELVEVLYMYNAIPKGSL